MAELPDDDVPTMAGTGERAGDGSADGDSTTAEARPPAIVRLNEGEEDDEHTVQQHLDEALAGHAPPKSVPPPLPPRATVPKRDSVLPPPPTTASPAQKTLRSPLSNIPGAVEIRTIEHDELLDETEVRTLANSVPASVAAVLDAARADSSRSPRPAAGAPPTEPEPSPADEESDSVTTQAPAPRLEDPDTDLAPRTLSPPTLSTNPASTRRTGPPRSSSQAPVTTNSSDADEPPTRPGMDEPPTQPGVSEDSPTKPGAGDSPTKPGFGEPPTLPRLGDEKGPRAPVRPAAGSGYYEGDDSVTSKKKPVDDEIEDSITAQAPAVPVTFISAVTGAGLGDLDDATDGTTQKVRRKRQVSSPADEEAESITTQAPGPLTNMLRVIAASEDGIDRSKPAGRGSQSEDVGFDDEDEEPAENKTAVMPNAPLQRVMDAVNGGSGGMAMTGPQGTLGMQAPLRPTSPGITMKSGRAATAALPQLEPSSESGLRIARPEEHAERASLGVLGVGDPRGSGMAPVPMGPDGHHANDGRYLGPPDISFKQPSVHDVDLNRGGPSYGPLVAIVAIVSIVVPVTLFIALRKNDVEASPDAPTSSAPVSPAGAARDFQNHDPPRTKADKTKPGASASAAASGSASASASASSTHSRPGGGRPPPGPKH